MTDQTPPPAESKRPHDPAFAPDDYTDTRKPGQWQTRWDAAARRRICMEAIYLALLLLGVAVLGLTEFFFDGICKKLLTVPDTRVPAFRMVFAAWSAGTVGGTLFATKWLYHSVAKFSWNADRLLWRLFTPHLSGTLAVAFVVIISSGLVNIFNKSDIRSSVPLALAVGFLVGYFSDSAVAKLTEVASTLFGETSR
jgi:hypothetical protein